MKGLVLKDLLVLKTTMKTVILIIVIFGFMGAMNGSTYMTTFASVYAAILPMTCMAYDERSHFNRYAVTMPIKPAHIALSKYVTGLVLAAAAMVIAVLMAVFTKAPIPETMLSCIAIPVLYHTFMLPLMFLFGTEKSRIIILIGVVVPALLVGFAEDAGILGAALERISNTSATVIGISLAVALFVMYVASIFISIAICKKKEW